MTFVGLNWFLSNKKVALILRKPLDVLHVSNRNLDWQAVTLEMWNYFSSDFVNTTATISGIVKPGGFFMDASSSSASNMELA